MTLKPIHLFLVCAVMAGLLFASSMFHSCQMQKLQHELAAQQQAMADSMIARLDHIAQTHRDSVLIIRQTIGAINERKKEVVATVWNTTDMDGLVDLYYRHRADLRH